MNPTPHNKLRIGFVPSLKKLNLFENNIKSYKGQPDRTLLGKANGLEPAKSFHSMIRHF